MNITKLLIFYKIIYTIIISSIILLHILITKKAKRKDALEVDLNNVCFFV